MDSLIIWFDESLVDILIDWLTDWLTDWMTDSFRSWVSEWVASEWVRVSESKCDRMRVSRCEWASKWMSEWVSEWVVGCMKQWAIQVANKSIAKENKTQHTNAWTTWWRHQMETFSALLALCAGNSSVTGEFPAQRPVTRSFDVFFDLRLNKRLNKQSLGWWFETLSRPL